MSTDNVESGGSEANGTAAGAVAPPVVGTGGVSEGVTVTGSADPVDTGARDKGAGSGRLAGKVAAITGATSGSGLAVAKLFAAEGASVVLLARGEVRLKALAETLGPNVTGIPTDVSDPDSVRAAFGLIAAQFGKLDILVNNAGIQRPCAVESLTDQEIAAQVGTNLLGPVYTSRSAIPLLRAAGGGEIINTSSEVTLEVFPYQSMYAVTKAGLESLGRSLNFEYEKEDIRTSTIIQGVALGEGGGALDWDHNPEISSVVWPRLQAEGTVQRIIGKHGGQHVDHVAEVHLFIVTRPRGQKLDVIRVRSY